MRGQRDRGSSGFGLLRLCDPVPLPQRLRLLCAAKRVERIGGDAGAVLGPGMIFTKNFAMRSEGIFAERQRFCRMLDEKQ